MAGFSDYLNHAKNFAGAARDSAHQQRSDYAHLHGNMPGAADYVRSDAGRAAARSAVGTGISRFLSNTTSKNFRRGNYLMGTLLTFAGHALSSHMAGIKADQRIFENVARVRRGDHSHMTHNELREVREHAAKYGGHDAAHIQSGADNELLRRQVGKGTDRARGQIHQDNLVHENRQQQRAASHANRIQQSSAEHHQTQAQKDEAHQNRIRRLRDTAGHTHEAKIAAAQKLSNIRKETEAAKTKGVQSRQKAIRSTLSAKMKPHLQQKTAKGGYYIGADGKRFYQADSTVARNKGKGTKKAAGAGARRRAV